MFCQIMLFSIAITFMAALIETLYGKQAPACDALASRMIVLLHIGLFEA